MNIQFAFEMLLLLVVFPLYCKSNRNMQNTLTNAGLLLQDAVANKELSDVQPTKAGSRVGCGYFEPE